MAQPKPFKLHVADADLDVLKQKLQLARLPDQPVGFDIQQGVPVSNMHRLINHWLTSYLPNWRQHEARLNEVPQFTTTVKTDEFGELDIHFVHQRSEVKDAIPLLFVHGWPGSFIEVLKLLPLLTQGDGKGPYFHVVAPSLPNYGFSESVPKRGFNLRHYAEVCHKLMLQLGYQHYVAQGGDWGSIITRLIGVNYPDHIRGVHVNMAFFNPVNLLKSPVTFLQALITWPFWPAQAWQALKNAQSYVSEGNAYYRMHATRPQTVAYCLSDSPVALLGWIYEKLIHWTDNYPWTDDEVLTWVSIYWFSRAGPGASVRTYFESEHVDPKFHGRPEDKNIWTYIPRQVKLGLTQFPKDIVGIPTVFAKTLGNVVFSNWASDGGHFAAYERPEYLADDLRRMFGKGGGAYACVESADGYGEDKKSI